MRSAAPTVLTLSIAAGLMTAASSAQALGFGRVANATQLGQRLNVGAVVRLDPDEALDRGCIFAEVAAGDSLLQPGQVRVTLEGGPDTLDRTVRVTTSTVIDEPVVTVSLTLGCNARSTRRFVVFIDPPGIDLAQATGSPAADAALLGPQREDSQVAPLVALLAPEPPRRATGRPRPEAVPDRARPLRQEKADRRSRVAAASAVASTVASTVTATVASTVTATVADTPRRSSPPAAAAPARTVAVAAKPPAAARLQLEAPTLAATAEAAAAAASVASADTLRLLQQERQRVESLEAGLARLQADAADTRKTVAGLQARLRVAEAERDADKPWVIALAGLSAVLAGLLAALAWRRRERRAAATAPWWKAGAAASLFGRHSVFADPPATPTDRPAQTLPGAASPALAGSVADDEQGSAQDGSAAPVTSAPSLNPVALALPADLATTSPHWANAPAGNMPSAMAPLEAPRPAADSSSSVEELIDLEQQAEFFVVLGQDEAAIDLLSQHLDTDGAASPLPYLKLLDIHRRRGDRAGYEAIRGRFNHDFNAYAPGWDADLGQGRSLDHYPEVIERLQRHWASPARAMELLEQSLFRRAAPDGLGGNDGSPSFDLPAYRELLSLYSLAREQAAATAGGGVVGGSQAEEVDLLLPLGAASGPASATEVSPIAWLQATTAMTATAAATRGAQPSAVAAGGVLSPAALGAGVGLGVGVDVDVSVPASRQEQAASFARHRTAPAEAAVGLPTPMPAPRAPRLPVIPVDQSHLETVPAALRRPDGHPNESVFVDLVLEPFDAEAR